MMPLSYNGFGFTAILMMVGCISIREVYRYARNRIIAINGRSNKQDNLHKNS
jgi:hypothetical protein